MLGVANAENVDDAYSNNSIFTIKETKLYVPAEITCHFISKRQPKASKTSQQRI